MENKHLISHFKIFAIGHKLSFKSNETVAKDIREALIADSNDIQDIKLYHGDYPVIKTTIYCKAMATTDHLLKHPSVRTILEKELTQ